MNHLRFTDKASCAATCRIGVAFMLLLLALVIFPKISRAADDATEGKQYLRSAAPAATLWIATRKART